MRKCPRCGMMFPEDRKVCTTRGCKRRTVEVIEWSDEDEAMAVKDLEDGIMADPFEDYDEDEDDSREDLVGQSDQIHDLLEKIKEPLTYPELGQLLDPPVSPKRAARLVSQMIRDGVELKREGTPRKVSLG